MNGFEFNRHLLGPLVNRLIGELSTPHGWWAAGAVTADLGGALGTRGATEAVIDAIRAIHWATAHRVQMHWA